MTNPPETIEFEAVRILREAGYLWDDSLFAFRRTRRVGTETTEEYLKSPPKVISFEELDANGLVLSRDIAARRTAPEALRNGISWLHRRLKEETPSPSLSLR
jgi:hypothetical protein